MDIWAIGCILYVLLFGSPPFESRRVQETYVRIKNNDYVVPENASPTANRLIRSLLDPVPDRRPTAEAVLLDQFFKTTIEPTYPPVHQQLHKEQDVKYFAPINPVLPHVEEPISPIYQEVANEETSEIRRFVKTEQASSFGDELSQLQAQISHILQNVVASKNKSSTRFGLNHSPEATPIFWVSQWVHFPNHGIGYRLCENSSGMLFNDNTQMKVNSAGNQLTFVDENNTEQFYTMNDQVPMNLQTKINIFSNVQSYMNTHLEADTHLEAEDQCVNKVPPLRNFARLPTIQNWFETKSAVIFHLSNGTVQINFLDHVKMVLCPLLKSVTFIEENKRVSTFTFANILTNSCPKKYLSRIEYAQAKIKLLRPTNNQEHVVYVDSPCRPTTSNTAHGAPLASSRYLA